MYNVRAAPILLNMLQSLDIYDENDIGWLFIELSNSNNNYKANLAAFRIS